MSTFGIGSPDHYKLLPVLALDLHPQAAIAGRVGFGPRVGESAFGKIARFPYTAPYEDITLKWASRNRCHG